MTRTRSRGWVGWMAVSFMAAALAGPAAAANRSVRSGPVYSSAGAIEWAQTVLQADGWLAKGAYTPGRDDRATLQAIREFQREHYLRATGMLDPETVGMLTSHARGAAPAPVRTSAASQESVALSAAVIEPPDKNAPSEAPAAPAESRPARFMPATGSPTTTLAAVGLLLALGGGILLWRFRV